MKLNEMIDLTMQTKPVSNGALVAVLALRLLGLCSGLASEDEGHSPLEAGYYATVETTDVVLKAIAKYGLPDDLPELTGGLGTFERAFGDGPPLW